MTNEQSFKSRFEVALGNRSIGMAKLSELSGVSERYLEALRGGNFDHLPSAPYVRGYIQKIAGVLGADAEELWTAYRLENQIKTSGAEDRLPENRFLLKKIAKGQVAAAAAVILVGAYAFLHFNRIIGNPELTILNPQVATVVVNTDKISVRGEITPGDKLFINGAAAAAGADGHFERELPLSPGINNLEIKSKRFLGREVSEIRRVIYQPAEDASATTSPSVVGQ